MDSANFVGAWKGTKKLYFKGPPEPDCVSDSNVVVSAVANGTFLTLTYTWTFKENDHEASMLFGKLGADEVSVAWVDSFHQSGSIMVSEGSLVDGVFDVKGSYPAPPGPDWGWRTQIKSDGETLNIIMYNIFPDGKEVLAVDAEYKRA